MPTTEQQEIYVSIWAKAVETQMHFNEMSVKSRQFGLAFVASALGLGIVLLSRHEEFSIPLFAGLSLPVTAVIAFASAAALYAVMLLDLGVYHKMLRGAVAFGEDFEQNYMKEIFALKKGMTQAISHFSRYKDASVTPQDDGKYFYCGSERGSAEQKIKRFYVFTISILVIVGCVQFWSDSNS
jgi:hypothetical protein